MRGDGRAWDGVALVTLGLLVRLGALAALGPQTASDTESYVTAARTWARTGLSLGWLLWSYGERSPGYVAFLAATGGSTPGGGATFVAQALLSAMLPALLYLALRRAGGGRARACLAAGAMVVSYELTRWNGYILTDSMLVAVSTLTMAATILALRAEGGLWAVGAGLGALLALSVRPTGLAVAVGALGAGVLWRPRRRDLAVAALAAMVLYGAWLWSTPEPPARRLFAGYLACGNVVSGRVFWGDPRYGARPLGPSSDWRGLSPGQCLRRLAATAPLGALGVMVRRAIVYWMPGYGHYSLRHNMANALLLGVPLGLGIVGACRGIGAIRSDPLTLVPLAWATAFTAQHALTWVDVDHRFVAPVLPAVYVLAVGGALRVAALVRARLRPDGIRVVIP